VLSGTTEYGSAVTKVRQGLANPGNPSLPDLLICVLILLLHSSSNLKSGESQSHVMGLFALLQMCGPKSFQKRPLRDAFSSCRATLATVGLLQKTRLFLEQEEWRCAPWALDPASKSNQDQLVDFLVQVPGFLGDQKALRTDFTVEKRYDLVRRASAQLQLLFHWRIKWESRNPAAARDIVRAGVGPSQSIPAEASRILVFSSFQTAVEIALYNAVLLCYLGLLYTEMTVEQAQEQMRRIAASVCPANTTQTNQVLALPGRGAISFRAAAIEIARSFEYQLMHVQHCPETPALFWLFPLGLSAKVLSDDAVMSQWIQDLLSTSEVTRGYGRGANAFGFGFYELPKVNEQVGVS
jgi:hypothetical protein